MSKFWSINNYFLALNAHRKSLLFRFRSPFLSTPLLINVRTMWSTEVQGRPATNAVCTETASAAWGQYAHYLVEELRFWGRWEKLCVTNDKLEKRLLPGHQLRKGVTLNSGLQFPGRRFFLLPHRHLFGSSLRTAGTSALKQRARMWPRDYSISLTFQGPHNLHTSLFNFIRHGRREAALKSWKQHKQWGTMGAGTFSSWTHRISTKRSRWRAGSLLILGWREQRIPHLLFSKALINCSLPS